MNDDTKGMKGNRKEKQRDGNVRGRKRK